jgi:hypothetical protein
MKHPNTLSAEQILRERVSHRPTRPRSAIWDRSVLFIGESFFGRKLYQSFSEPVSIAKRHGSKLSMTVVGTVHLRFSGYNANRAVKAIRLDYLLSNGACIAPDNLNLEGESFDGPLQAKSSELVLSDL